MNQKVASQTKFSPAGVGERARLEVLARSSSRALLLTFFLLLILVFAIGCQRDADSPTHSSSQPSPPPPRGSAHSLTQLRELLLPPLVCDRARSCPSAIGELVTMTSAGVSTCTATLVAPDIILTASHCVPWENVEQGGRIGAHCWVRWPRPNLKSVEEAIPCQRVKLASTLSSANEGEAQADYAYLRLATRSRREPMRIVQAPRVRDGYHALYGVNPGPAFHFLRGFECRSERARGFPSKTINPERAFAMPRCSAVVGNSGGPILDRGLIVGVISFVETPMRPGGVTAVGSHVGLPTIR